MITLLIKSNDSDMVDTRLRLVQCLAIVDYQIDTHSDWESQMRYLMWLYYLKYYLIPQNNRLMSRMTRNRHPLSAKRPRVRKGRYFSGLG